MCALNKDISDEDKISDEQYFEKESNQFNICSEIGIFSEFNITNSDSYHSENFFKFFPFYSAKSNSDESEDYHDNSFFEDKIYFNSLHKEKEGSNLTKKTQIPNKKLKKEKIPINNDLENKDDKGSKFEKVYSLDEILKLIWDIIPENIQNNFKNETVDYITKKDKQSVALFQTPNKKKKNQNSFSKKEKAECLGRKRNEDNSERSHTKNNQDNIIKKCKAIFISNVISYINEYIKFYSNHKTFQLLALDYKYVNNITKKDEIELLDTKLKDLASLETSTKFKLNKNIFINKNQIENILEEEKNNEIINKLLNMTFGEWIDIFTLKKELFNDFEYWGLKFALEKNAKENNTEYFARFLFFLFNYKRWFISKNGRAKRKKEN